MLNMLGSTKHPAICGPDNHLLMSADDSQTLRPTLTRHRQAEASVRRGRAQPRHQLYPSVATTDMQIIIINNKH